MARGTRGKLVIARQSGMQAESSNAHKRTLIRYLPKRTRNRLPRSCGRCDDEIDRGRSGRIVTAALLLAPSPVLAAPDTTGSVLTVLLSLTLILGGFVAVAWLARRYLPGMGAQGAVKVVGTTPVGTRERVVLVEVGGTWLLLGVGGGNVRLLHTLPKPDAAQERAR